MAQDRSGQIARTRISMQPGMCFGIVLAGGLSRRMGGARTRRNFSARSRDRGGEATMRRPGVERQRRSGTARDVRFSCHRRRRARLQGSARGHFSPGSIASPRIARMWNLQSAWRPIRRSCRTILPPASRTRGPKTTPWLLARARAGGRIPLATLWPVAIRRELRQAFVEKDMRKAKDFLHNYRRATVDWPVEPFDPFFNVNQPDDLAAAEAILSRRETHIA
jgi:molybdenum cofactor guanylyltransferase